MMQKMYLNINGQDVECNIVARWSLDGHNYIAYTDPNKLSQQGQLIIAKCITEDGELKLYDIDNDEEWTKAKEFLDSFLEDGVIGNE